ncbi:hypothetical protein Bca4012_066856 [Brassica carinata]
MKTTKKKKKKPFPFCDIFFLLLPFKLSVWKRNLSFTISLVFQSNWSSFIQSFSSSEYSRSVFRCPHALSTSPDVLPPPLLFSIDLNLKIPGNESNNFSMEWLIELLQEDDKNMTSIKHMFFNNESSSSTDRTHSTLRLLQFLDPPPRLRAVFMLANSLSISSPHSYDLEALRFKSSFFRFSISKIRKFMSRFKVL